LNLDKALALGMSSTKLSGLQVVIVSAINCRIHEPISYKIADPKAAFK
jgi:hypothetical protein